MFFSSWSKLLAIDIIMAFISGSADMGGGSLLVGEGDPCLCDLDLAFWDFWAKIGHSGATGTAW